MNRRKFLKIPALLPAIPIVPYAMNDQSATGALSADAVGFLTDNLHAIQEEVNKIILDRAIGINDHGGPAWSVDELLRAHLQSDQDYD